MKHLPTPLLVRIHSSLEPPTTPSSGPSLSEDFLRSQSNDRTRQEYAKAIDYFCRSMAPDRSHSAFLLDFLALSQAEAVRLVLDWQQFQISEGRSPATINQRISALKALVKFAVQSDACSFSLREIKSLKVQHSQSSQTVSEKDFHSILALVDRSTDLGSRNYAILLLLWDLSLRRSEVVSLNLSDYHSLNGTLMILGTAIILDAGVREAIDDWLYFRSGLYFQPKNGSRPDSALFLSSNGRRLSGTDIFRVLRSYADDAGVQASPHNFRRF